MNDMRNLNIIQRLLDGEEKVTINNESIQMKQLRELESKFKIDENRLKNVILFWDDFVQFTSLGLIDIMLEKFIDIDDKEYSYDEFFYRGFEGSNSLQFVKKLFLTRFNTDIDEGFIKKFNEAYYTDILLRSPASTFFSSFIRCEGLYKNVLVCFKHRFDGIEKFVNSIKGRFTGKFKIDIQFKTLDGYFDESEFLEKNAQQYDTIMIQNLSQALEYIHKSQHMGMSLVSPYGHNGVHPEYFRAISEVYGSSRHGPYNSELVIFNEGIAIC